MLTSYYDEIDLLINELIKRNEFELAEKYLLELIKKDSSNSKNISKLGFIKIKLLKWSDAEKIFKDLIQIEEFNYDMYNQLILSLIKQHKLDEALLYLNNLLKFCQYGTVFYNIGVVLKEKGAVGEAETNFLKCIEIDPDFSDAYYNLGCLYFGSDFIKSVFYFDRAITINPNYVDAHWNKSILLLKNGYYFEGWKEFEWRLKKKEHQLYSTNFYYWNNDQLVNRKILIVCEQGFGDNIQFVRFLYLLKNKGCYIILKVRTELKRLFQNLDCIDELVDADTNIDNPDYFVSLLSIPYLLSVSEKDLSFKYPYINLPAQNIKNLAGNNKLNVGILWEGSKYNRSLLHRHCMLEDYKPILEIEEIQIFSLQYKFNKTNYKQYFDKYSILEIDPSDFYDTAVEINKMDLIITIDSAVAHLAGAMGKTTFLLLTEGADWRWIIKEGKSPWYPSFIIFEKKNKQSWNEIMIKVREEVLKILGNKIN